jgi:hypothetical protein
MATPEQEAALQKYIAQMQQPQGGVADMMVQGGQPQGLQMQTGPVQQMGGGFADMIMNLLLRRKQEQGPRVLNPNLGSTQAPMEQDLVDQVMGTR